MSPITLMFAEISNTGTNPATVVAMTLSTVSAGLVTWKAINLAYRVRIARRIAEEFELLASSRRTWEVEEKSSQEMSVSPVDRVNSALKVLSKIDLEPYLTDRVTRNLVDHSLAILYSQLFENHSDRSAQE
jgi:hypothetical protein